MLYWELNTKKNRRKRNKWEGERELGFANIATEVIRWLIQLLIYAESAEEEMIKKAKNIQDCIDAGITGGTLNTAKHAFQQGKPVIIGGPSGDPEKDKNDFQDLLKIIKGEKNERKKITDWN